jgi:hypothetical protein
MSLQPGRQQGKFAADSFRQVEGRIEGKIVPFAAMFVPAPRRQDWVKEWQAELWQLRHGDRPMRHEPGVLEVLSLTYGLMADAVWLRLDWSTENARGSAASCLWALSAYCLLCGATELVVAGSWHSFARILLAHFLGSFLFVAVPAVFVAMATYPLRPLRCDGKHMRAEGRLSSRARWNLFLAAKVVLTLVLGFLISVVATGPAHALIGRYADWVELLTSALAVTIGLRWALLNQEQRCQKCLRMLSQPTRVGPPSRNFLDWSGTELVCADGHGRLHVPEMQGSWCWYDRWVELDPSWGGLFSA